MASLACARPIPGCSLQSASRFPGYKREGRKFPPSVEIIVVAGMTGGVEITWTVEMAGIWIPAGVGMSTFTKSSG